MKRRVTHYARGDWGGGVSEFIAWSYTISDENRDPTPVPAEILTGLWKITRTVIEPEGEAAT